MRVSTAFVKDAFASPDGQKGWGRTEISDRLELLGGTMEIRTQPGSGTHVHSVTA